MKRVVLKLMVLIVGVLIHNAAIGEYTTNYANVDVSRWKCFLCEFETYRAATGRLSVASVLTTDDSDRFGRNGSFERAGTRLILDSRVGINKTNGWVLSASTNDIGLDSNDISIKINSPRSLKASVRLQEYRRLTESNALTPFIETNGRLALGPQWHRDLQTSGFTSLAMSNQRIELATTRHLLESTVSVDVLPNVELSLFHRSASKEGVQETFRDDILQSTALPKGIDHESVTNRIQISYRDQRLNTTWARSASTFKNLEPVLHWESPYRFGLLENESTNAFSHDHSNETLDVRFNLPLNGMLRFHERRGVTDTEPRSMRYGLSSLISDTEPVHLFAERDYQSRRLVLLSQLNRDIEVSVARSQYELKNRRSTESLTPALGGLFLTPSLALRSGDLERQESELELNYRPATGTRVLSRIWETVLTRTNQEIEHNQTRGLEVKLTQPLFESWETFTTISGETRSASEFQDITANNPNTRRFHQAPMKRRVWTGGMRFSPRKLGESVSLSVDVDRRDYPQTILGLSAEEVQGLTLAYSLRIGKRIVTDGHIASHRRTTEINGAQSLDLLMPWTYSSDDVVDSAGFKLLIEPFNRFVDNILVGYTLSDGQAKLATSFDDTNRFFPNQISRHESIDVEVGFGETYGLNVEARVYFEDYDARDWSIDNADQTKLANILTMARDHPSYENALISLRINRSF